MNYKKWLRWAWVLTALAICVLAAFIVSGLRTIELRTPAGSASLDAGSFILGRVDNTKRPYPMKWDFGITEASYNQGGLYWRPIHSTNIMGMHRFHFPLWQPLVAFTGAACFAWGYALAMRRGGRGGCPTCGYTLRGLTASDGVITCPECGQKTNPALR